MNLTLTAFRNVIGYQGAVTKVMHVIDQNAAKQIWHMQRAIAGPIDSAVSMESYADEVRKTVDFAWPDQWDDVPEGVKTQLVVTPNYFKYVCEWIGGYLETHAVAIADLAEGTKAFDKPGSTEDNYRLWCLLVDIARQETANSEDEFEVVAHMLKNAMFLINPRDLKSLAAKQCRVAERDLDLQSSLEDNDRKVLMEMLRHAA